jgi:hypothetical protein
MKVFLSQSKTTIASILFVAAVLSWTAYAEDDEHRGNDNTPRDSANGIEGPLKHDDIIRNSVSMVLQGRNIFRYDTYGDEAFWGDTLQLHQALNQLTPRQALGLGLKVDADALSEQLRQKIRQGKIDLDDPAVTLTLLRRNAVLGVVGVFDGEQLRSVGLTCAVCHSTVNDSVAPSIGRRLDGWDLRSLPFYGQRFRCSGNRTAARWVGQS